MSTIDYLHSLLKNRLFLLCHYGVFGVTVFEIKDPKVRESVPIMVYLFCLRYGDTLFPNRYASGVSFSIYPRYHFDIKIPTTSCAFYFWFWWNRWTLFVYGHATFFGRCHVCSFSQERKRIVSLGGW